MSYVDELNEAITALFEENQELRDERDRARRIAVALEQELDAGVWGRIDQAAFGQGMESGEVDDA